MKALRSPSRRKMSVLPALWKVSPVALRCKACGYCAAKWFNKALAADDSKAASR